MTAYLTSLLEVISPKVVLTNIDNSYKFFDVASNLSKKMTFVAVQNAARYELKENEYLYNGCWATTIVIGKEHKIKAKDLMKEINKKGLPVRPFFTPLGSMKPFFYKKSKKENKNSYDIYSRGLTLPSALNLNENQIY